MYPTTPKFYFAPNTWLILFNKATKSSNNESLSDMKIAGNGSELSEFYKNISLEFILFPFI